MVDFANTSFEDLKDDVQKKITWGGGSGYLWMPGTYASFSTWTIPPSPPT